MLYIQPIYRGASETSIKCSLAARRNESAAEEASPYPVPICNVGMEILKLFRSEALLSALLQDRLLIQSQLIQLATR